MVGLALRVVGADGRIKAEQFDKQEVSLVYHAPYEEGDMIVFYNSEPEKLYVLSVDAAIAESLVYVTREEVEYAIPFGEKKVCYCPQAFSGDVHLITAREAYEWEKNSYRNMAVNAMDQHGDTGIYPHAFANVETRGESVFAARNAIDGCLCNHSHGQWPYGSWGINGREDAEIVVNFGREILADRVILHTRADFPHDSWWIRAIAEFSDGTETELALNKTSHGQEFVFLEEKRISWIKLKNLKKADDPSPYPALTQIAVYGSDLKDDE